MQTKSETIVSSLEKKGWKKELVFPHDYTILQKGNNCILIDLFIKKIITEWGSEKPSMENEFNLKEFEKQGWEPVLPYPHNYVVLKKNSHLLLVDTSVNKIVVSWTE